MDKIKCLRGSDELAQYFRVNNITHLTGLSDGYYYRNGNGWDFKPKVDKYIPLMELCTFEEYFKTNNMENDTNMKTVKCLKGCDELNEYFRKNGISHLNGNNPLMNYYIKDNGEWGVGEDYEVDGVLFEVMPFNDFFKTNNMENKIPVSKSFIMAAYDAACDSWRNKIEKELPELFVVDNIIGKTYIPSDMSYSKCLQNIDMEIDLWKKPCTVISEPFKEESGYGCGYEFVNVLYKTNTFKVLYFPQNVQK